MQGAQKLGSEVYLQVRRNDEDEVKSRSERDSWIFYETIKYVKERRWQLSAAPFFGHLSGICPFGCSFSPIFSAHVGEAFNIFEIQFSP
jgi:hypothetical protein